SGDFSESQARFSHFALAPIVVTALAATSTARRAASPRVAPRRYEAQNAAANASPAPVGATSSTTGAVVTSPRMLHPPDPSLMTGTFARRSGGAPRTSASCLVAN